MGLLNILFIIHKFVKLFIETRSVGLLIIIDRKEMKEAGDSVVANTNRRSCLHK
jgi:hypothetical protein